MTDDLYLIAINLTQRCNLACAHCYMDAKGREQGGDELDTGEIQALLEEIASRSNETMVVLTGGEPLLRRDLETLVRHGSQLGLSMVVGSNGVLLTEERARSLQTAGVMGLGISLDSLDPNSHDGFRGSPGSWEKTLQAMDHCRQLQLPFQLHFSVTAQNAHEVPAVIDFARASGAHVLNIFFLVCTGRGETMSDISPTRYEEVLRELVQAQQQSKDLIIRARCAPHFKRVAYEADPESPLTRAQGYDGGGCLAGIHYCRITPGGEVTACPYIPDGEGNIRDQGFWAIWDNAENFRRLRNPELRGKCGKCEYRKLCGGCRARPMALGGDLMDADPWCNYQPTGMTVIQPLTDTATSNLTWTAEAEQRLARIPGFLRKMVRKRAENHVLSLAETEVTVAHLTHLAHRRFDKAFPGIRPRPTGETAPTKTLSWTAEARDWLEALPGFLRDDIQTLAEDAARNEGRLEVNKSLLDRLQKEGDSNRKLPWTAEAESCMDHLLQQRAPQAAVFIRPTLEAAAEREAKRRSAIVVARQDVKRIFTTDMAGVEWDSQALSRVESAPSFIRGGIKKAAEFNARREGLASITTDDLTRFRNRAMMKAVRRMRGFGMGELSFDAFNIARHRVPRLRENRQAERRFAEIRHHVEQKKRDRGGAPGIIDQALLRKMKDELEKKQ